VSRVLTAHQHN